MREDSVRDYLDKGDFLYYHKYYRYAIDYYIQAHNVNKYNQDAILKLAAAYERNQQYKEAIMKTNELLEMDPQSSSAYLIQGLANENSGKFEKAEKSYLKALSIDPDYYEANHNLAILYENQNKIDEAKKYYLKSIEINSKDEFSIQRLSYIYNSEQDYGSLIKMQTKIAEINPDSHSAYGNLAVGYAQNHQLKKALDSLDRAIQLDPKDFSSYYNKAIILLDLNRLNESAECLHKAISINNKSAEARYLLGKVYSLKKEYTKAVKQFKIVSKEYGEDAEIYLRIADCYINMDNYKTALKVLEEIIKKDPQNIDANIKKGILLSIENRYADAEKCFNTVQHDHKDSTAGFYYMGVMYMNRKEYEKAIKQFRLAEEIESQAAIYYMRSKCYIMLNKNEEALRDLVDCCTIEKSKYKEIIDDDFFQEVKEELKKRFEHRE